MPGPELEELAGCATVTWLIASESPPPTDVLGHREAAERHVHGGRAGGVVDVHPQKGRAVPSRR